jgi:UDP-N-acetylglucosamine 1-carboxyvinyltransferase
MDKIIIGGKRPSGTIPISGAKNAALTLLPCALLTDEPLTLRNLPRLADIDGFQHLMNQFGVTTTIAGSRPEDFGRVMTLERTRSPRRSRPMNWSARCAPRSWCSARCWRAWAATVSLPGGCADRQPPDRPALRYSKAFGAPIELAAGYVRGDSARMAACPAAFASGSLGRRDREAL